MPKKSYKVRFGLSVGRRAKLYCEHFKDKDLVVELPCKAGDTVYHYCDCFHEIAPYEISPVYITKHCIQYEAIWHSHGECMDSIDFENADIGKTVFLTQEEAEAKLKEREQ